MSTEYDNFLNKTAIFYFVIEATASFTNIVRKHTNLVIKRAKKKCKKKYPSLGNGKTSASANCTVPL